MAIGEPAAHPASPTRDHSYHPLRVARVDPETADARSFVLDVPPELAATFAYAAGQFCTFRVSVDGHRYFRCYSMCSSPDVDDELRVTVKRVPDGVVSNWMNDALAAGDLVDVAPPAGNFRLGTGTGEVVLFGAGSGITPIYSLIKTALATTSRPIRLLYANRDRDSVIFGTELEALTRTHADRFTVVHHLDVEDGFVGAGDVEPLVEAAVDGDFYLCGPAPFMDIVEQTLLDQGVDAGRIHIERFTPAEPPAPEPDEPADETQVTIELGGRTATTEHHPGTTILQTARQLGLDPPFSCESGNCATCMARLVDGAVRMHVNDALTPDEVDEGWILTCQSVPTTPNVHVVYEE